MTAKRATKGNRPYRQAGAVIVAAGCCWGVGISFVGMVHATKDPAARLAMLQRSRGPWIAGQFLAAAGTAALPGGEPQIPPNERPDQLHARGPRMIFASAVRASAAWVAMMASPPPDRWPRRSCISRSSEA